MAAQDDDIKAQVSKRTKPRCPSIQNHDAANVGVYVLANFDNRSTYVGCTVDFHRRLRQHNSQLVGGARRTKCSTTWHHRILVTGFSEWKTALSFEWYVKNYRRLDSAADKRLKGIAARRARITALMAKFGTCKFAGLTVTDVPPPPPPPLPTSLPAPPCSVRHTLATTKPVETHAEELHAAEKINLEVPAHKQVHDLELNANKQVHDFQVPANKQVYDLEVPENKQVHDLELNANKQVHDLELHAEEQIIDLTQMKKCAPSYR
jgi:predicted GIY-YIG superfamily endonuclease